MQGKRIPAIVGCRASGSAATVPIRLPPPQSKEEPSSEMCRGPGSDTRLCTAHARPPRTAIQFQAGKNTAADCRVQLLSRHEQVSPGFSQPPTEMVSFIGTGWTPDPPKPHCRNRNVALSVFPAQACLGSTLKGREPELAQTLQRWKRARLEHDYHREPPHTAAAPPFPSLPHPQHTCPSPPRAASRPVPAGASQWPLHPQAAPHETPPSPEHPIPSPRDGAREAPGLVGSSWKLPIRKGASEGALSIFRAGRAMFCAR